MHHALAVLFLILFAVIPAVFWFYGKRLFGEQTHPAAIAILAWIACLGALNFGMFGSAMVPLGPTAMLWVAVNFGVFSLVRKFRRKNPRTDSRRGDESQGAEGNT